MTTTADRRRLVIFGAGGHAKSALAVLRALPAWDVAGLVEDGATADGRLVLGHRVLGDRSCLPVLRAQGVDSAFVAIGDNAARCAVGSALEAAGFALATIVHPAALLMADAVVGRGSFVHALAIVGPECRVGNHAIVAPNVTLGHESTVGDAVQFTSGVHVGGRVRIGDRCFLGPGCVVYPRVTIGNDVQIGANSVINRDVADGCIVAGNPARLVRRVTPP
jgi:UDP-perosamine 4-acetyltransferase